MTYNITVLHYESQTLIMEQIKMNNLPCRIYLRASTQEQNASRARESLIEQANSNGLYIAGVYTENESGSTLNRPELMRMLSDAQIGDIILIEDVSRIARLNSEDWESLKVLIKEKHLAIVTDELPTSMATAVNSKRSPDEFTTRVMASINDMLLDMLAAIARKDYEDRRRKQAEGIAQNKHKFKGRQVNQELHKRIAKGLAGGMTQRAVAEFIGCSVATVNKVAKTLKS